MSRKSFSEEEEEEEEEEEGESGDRRPATSTLCIMFSLNSIIRLGAVSLQVTPRGGIAVTRERLEGFRGGGRGGPSLCIRG